VKSCLRYSVPEALVYGSATLLRIFPWTTEAWMSFAKATCIPAVNSLASGRILLATTLFASLFPFDTAFAIQKRVASSITCTAVQDIVQRDGAIILRYPSKRVPGLTLYDRYVRSELQCDGNMEATPKSVGTAGSQCQLQICHERSRTDN